MRLGWRFHRIWSTDWFNHREEEVERSVAAYNDALRRGALSPPTRKRSQNSGGKSNARGPAPVLQRRESISEYTDFELINLAKWAMSDGQLRTDEDLLNDMFEQLPFTRRGPRIRERLKFAIARAKRYEQKAS